MRDNRLPAADYQLPATITRKTFILIGSLMAAIGIIGYVIWAANGGLVNEGNWIGVDFHVYYQAAKVLGRGEDIYSAGIAPPYVYPPLLAILVWPLSLLNVTTATITWKLIQHLCLIAAGWLLVRLLPTGVRPLAAGLLLLGLLTSPVLSEIRLGESNSLVLLFIVGALYLVARGDVSQFAIRNPQFVIAAGVLLTLAVSIKVLPVLLVAYLWWRGPRNVAAIATGGFIALQLLSQLITPSTAHYWFGVFPDLFGQAFPYLDNQSINATLSRALLPTDPSLPNMQIADGESLRPILTWIANVLTVGAAAWVLWTAHKRTPGVEGEAKTIRFLLEVGLVLLTTHLVSGSTWLHHLVALAVPMTALVGAWWLELHAGQRGRATLGIPLVLGVSMLLLLQTPQEWLQHAGTLAQQSTILALIISSTATLVVITLWVAVATILVQSPKSKVDY